MRLGTDCVVIFVALGLAAGCGRQPSLPENASDHAQKLPFDREARGNGVSPTKSLVPAGTRLGEGKAIAIRLRAPLSSASAHGGETFDGTLEEPVVDEGQTLIPRGAAVVGRVLDAKQSAGNERGYLRIALVSVQVGGKTVLIDTSSIFAKAGARDGGAAKDVVLTPERRLTFHVVRGVDLP
ncbi:MAG: hypothetical protein WA609_16920 [Terriglobales bacterium]